MINSLEKKILKRIISTKCPDSFCNRKNIKCYAVLLKSKTDKCLLYVDKINSNGFSGTHRKDQNSESYPASVPFSLMDGVSIEIIRYIGFSHFTYPSVFQCVLYDWTYGNRLHIMRKKLSIMRDKMAQFLFNRRDLALKEKINVLDVLVEKYIENSSVSFSEENLLDIIHSPRWSRHPDSAKQLAYARIILNSLIESGELQEDKDTLSAEYLYKLTGKALTTLETYNREKKRHDQIRNLTFALVVVGIIQAIAGFIQAYLAYIPKKP